MKIFSYVAIGLLTTFTLGSAQDYWEESTLNANNIFSVTQSDGNVIVGTDNGIHVSEDGGETWTHFRLGGLTVSAFALNTENFELYAATSGGVYVSPRRGMNWSRIIEATGNIVTDVGYTKFFELDVRYAAGPGFGLSDSQNGGTWRGYAVPANDVIHVAPRRAELIFLGTQSNGVLVYANESRDHNNPGDWTLANNGLEGTEIRALESLNFGAVFAGTPNGMFRSIDGAEWTKLFDGSVTSISFEGLDRIFVGTENDGIYRSDDAGTTYRKLAGGINETIITGVVALNDGTVFAGTLGSGLYKNTGAMFAFPRPVLDTICRGESTRLLANVEGGVGDSFNFTYEWSPAELIDDPNARTPSASPTESTEFTVIITDTENNSVEGKLTVYVSTPPEPEFVFDGDPQRCAGDPITLDPGEFESYFWFDGSTTQTITISDPGEYNVEVTVTERGCSVSSSIDVTIYEFLDQPTVRREENTLICEQNATSYQWYRDGTEIPGATNMTWEAQAIGLYTVSVSNSTTHICTTLSDEVDVDMIVSVRESQHIRGVSIFPNPSSGQATITGHIVGAQELQMQITDVVGRVVSTFPTERVDGFWSRPLHTQSLPAGVYFVRIDIGGDQIVRQLIMHNRR